MGFRLYFGSVQDAIKLLFASQLEALVMERSTRRLLHWPSTTKPEMLRWSLDVCPFSSIVDSLLPVPG